MEGNHVGHQLVKGDVPVELAGCCATATLVDKKKEKKHFQKNIGGGRCDCVKLAVGPT